MMHALCPRLLMLRMTIITIIAMHPQRPEISVAPSPADPTSPGILPPRADRLCRSQALFDGARELLIDHHGVLYRLRLTAQGKLILTK